MEPWRCLPRDARPAAPGFWGEPLAVCRCVHARTLSDRTLGSWAAVWCFVSGCGGLGEDSAGHWLISPWEGRAGSCPGGLRIASPSPACVHGNRILFLQTARLSKIARGAWELRGPRGMGAAGRRLVPKEAGGGPRFCTGSANPTPYPHPFLGAFPWTLSEVKSQKLAMERSGVRPS